MKVMADWNIFEVIIIMPLGYVVLKKIHCIIKFSFSQFNLVKKFKNTVFLSAEVKIAVII